MIIMITYNLRINKKTCIRLTIGRLLLLFFGCCGLAILIYRLINGLGAATNLFDKWPWGFWIYCDLVLSAIGSCGFAVGILTHVFGIKKYMPLARRALFVSLLCYLLLFLILFAEIGRWDNFYWVFISFAWTSPLYEVFICLTLYVLVQFAEAGEVWLDHYLPKLHQWVVYLMPLIFLAAAILPFGQEAALGALYLAMSGKLNAIWCSQALPWNFLISAFYGGLCFIALEYRVTNRYLREKSDGAMIGSLLKIAAVVILLNLVIKIIDISVRGVWGEVFSGTVEGNLFIIEIIFGSLIPIILSFLPMLREPPVQKVVAFLGILGVVINRFNIIFTGMARHAEISYFPSFAEIGLVIGLTSLMIFVYIICVENLPVFWGYSDEKPRTIVR